jgi:hypothetical protein
MSLAISPLQADELPELAQFIARAVEVLRSQQGLDTVPAHLAADQRVAPLRRRLFDSPFLEPGIPPGFVLRDAAGAMVGSLLLYPWRYAAGEERLLGLGSGAFFVDPAHRTGGFFLFRKYLAARGPDFFWGNSCNPSSAALWRMLKGRALPGSELEHLIVLRPGPILEELLLRKQAPGPVARLAGAVAAGARPLFHRRRSTGDARPERDYQRLAEVAARHRPPRLITTERSPAYLEWRYGGEERDGELYRFDAPGGGEGWFSVAMQRRGRREQIRGARLLDAVWPRQAIGLDEVVRSALHVIEGRADVLSIRPRAAFEGCQGLATFTRTLPAPEVFASSRTVDVDDLVRRLDSAAADVV